MKEKDFDKIIRDQMSHYESGFSEKLWNNIELELDKKTGTRALPYLAAKNILLLTSLMVIFTAVGYNVYKLYDNKKTIQPQETETLQTQNDIASIENNTSAHSTTTSNNDQTLTPEIQASGSSSTVQGTRTQYIASLNPSKSTTSNNFTKGSYNSSLASNFITQTRTKQSAGLLSASGQSDKSSSSEYAIDQSVIAREAVVRSLLTSRVMSVESGSSNAGPVFGLISDPKGNCPKFHTNVPEYFLEIFGSPDFHTSYLSVKDSEMAGYLGSRKNSETALPGYTIGLRAGMNFRNGLNLKAGMSYSAVNYRFDYRKEDVEVLKYKVVPSDTIHGNGTVAYVFDTIAYVEKGIRTVRHYNSLKSIELPVWIGYQKEFLRWTVGINAGASLQLVSMKTGKVLSPVLPNEPVEFSDSVNGHYNLYKRTLGVGILGSAQFGYKLTPDLDFVFEPYLKYYPKAITVDEYPLRQKLLVYGINIGLRLKI